MLDMSQTNAETAARPAHEAPSRHEVGPRPDETLPLHLRVLRAFIEGEASQTRVEHAFTLATEIYELEIANLSGPR